MTDVRPNPSGPAGATAAAAAPSADAADPLHNLYRMSRTAGLGAGDYVAINNTSVLAFLLGLGGVLALLTPLLVIIPIAAVVCGAIAIVKIRSSNGTQSGVAFAGLGILLGLAFGGVAVGQMVLANVERRNDEREVARSIKSLSDLITAEQYGQAYQSLFSEQFKKEFPEEVFTTRWENVKRSTGALASITWGGRTEFDYQRATDTHRAYCLAVFKFQNIDDPSPLAITFVDQGGEWMIERIANLLDPVEEKNQQQQDPRQLGPNLEIPGSPRQ